MFMERRKHKQNRKNHVIIVTSDAADAQAKQIRIRPWLLQILIIAGCVLAGAVIGYFINEGRIHAFVNRKTEAQQTVIERLEAENASLADQIDTERKQAEEKRQELLGQIKEMETLIENLNSNIAVLSDTVNEKTQNEETLTAILENQKIPSEYPLTGSASIDNGSNEEICIFKASAGATVAATAGGVVTAINDDGEYGHNVWVDHGNGYVTIYRNQGDVIVKLGDEVAHGTTIFVIGSKNTRFGYQIMKDGAYIDPMSMLSISG